MSDCRGYAFAAESFLAVLIFIMFFSISTNFFLAETENIFSRVVMKRIALDTLDVFDEINNPNLVDAAIITEMVDSVLPERLSWRMQLTQQDLRAGDFVVANVFLVGNTTTDISARDVVKAKRLFLTYDSGQVQFYNTAELWLWLE